MRARWTLLAWSLFGLFVVLACATLVLVATGWATGDQAFVLLCSGYAVVGALVASREPRNAVGWLMLTIALAFAFTSLTDSYIAGSADRPGEQWAAWISAWGWNVWLYVASGVLPFVFPDGRLVSPRWRYGLWLGIFTLVTSLVSTMVQPGPMDVDSPATITNPLGAGVVPQQVFAASSAIGNFVAVTVVVLGGASLVVRLRRSRGRTRQQVKWFVYVGAVAVAALVLALVDVINESIVGDPTPAWSQILGSIGWFTTLVSLVIGFPTAIGIAILRHRLYGIDLVINRTLVYGSLTVLLAATYLALVLGLRVVLSPVTGQSDLAVAASTLAVAGLFGPLRARIQDIVDRRFFRSRYDAERTLAGFATQLRSEIDLDSLGTGLRDVVSSTMHPEHVTLWLRSAS
jgi:hypothetical protein